MATSRLVSQSGRWISLVVASALVGCAPTDPNMRAQIQAQQMMATMMPPPSSMPSMAKRPAETAAPQLPSMTDEQLNAKIAKIPTLQHGVTFVRKRDGFDADGVRYIEPEGEIASYGTDYATGDVTYLAKTGTTDYIIKFTRVLTNEEPIVIGTAKRDASGWQVSLVTGKHIRGDRVIPMSRGVVITRESTAFKYVLGQGIKNFSAIDGWHIASYQNGDVSSTGYILLERDPSKKGGITDLINSAKAFGNTMGLTEKQDYMLVNVDSGKAVPLDIPIDGKQQQFLANCYQRNSFVSTCNESFLAESIWDRNGVKNFEHYFWRVQWFNSPRGPVAITQEHGLRDITITDLRTDEKATAFSRTLGIGGFEAQQTADGTINIVAQMGLKTEALPDSVAYLAKNGVVPAVADTSAGK